MESHIVDWEALHRRMTRMAASLAGTAEDDPDSVRRILEARARKAAIPPSSVVTEELLEIVVFSLAGESYGIETIFVQEVCPLIGFTLLPCTPPFIAGVMALRNRVLAIVDLRRFFDLPMRGITEMNKIVALRGNGNEFGLLADAIEGVRTVPTSFLQARLTTLTDVREKYLKGIIGERMLAILDGAKLLSDRELLVNDQAVR